MIFHLQEVWVEDRLGGRTCMHVRVHVRAWADRLPGDPSATHAREDSGIEVQRSHQKSIC